MKKVVLCLAIFFIAIAFSGCDSNTSITMMSYELDEFEVNNYSDAAMVILEDSVTSTGLSLELYYYGDDEGTTGSQYTLFVYQEDGWSELEDIVDGDVCWTMIAYIVEKNHPSEMSIGWEWLYGELTSGKYLIVKSFYNHRAPGDYDVYYLACEFEIS